MTCAARLRLAITVGCAIGVLASPSGAVAADTPRLASAVRLCDARVRAAFDVVGQAPAAGDFIAWRRAAASLGAQAEACAKVVARAPATGAVACGRAVAVGGLRLYRDGGRTIAGAAEAGVRAGDISIGVQEVFRGTALARIGGTQLAAALEVIRGVRGCEKGVALSPELKPATKRLIPVLAERVATMLIQAQGTIEEEDRIAFGLLAIHLDSGVPPPAGAAEAQIVRLQNQSPTIASWRLSGLRTFWSTHATGVDWARYAFGAERFLASYQTYIQWKVTSLQNQRNQFLSGIVGSEEAWRNALADWKSWEQRWYTREQASIAEYDAWNQYFRAERILADAEAIVRQRPP
jgi:hypothetical protein